MADFSSLAERTLAAPALSPPGIADAVAVAALVRAAPTALMAKSLA